jgi:hypothetical protein
MLLMDEISAQVQNHISSSQLTLIVCAVLRVLQFMRYSEIKSKTENQRGPRTQAALKHHSLPGQSQTRLPEGPNLELPRTSQFQILNKEKRNTILNNTTIVNTNFQAHYFSSPLCNPPLPSSVLLPATPSTTRVSTQTTTTTEAEAFKETTTAEASAVQAAEAVAEKARLIRRQEK